MLYSRSLPDIQGLGYANVLVIPCDINFLLFLDSCGGKCMNVICQDLHASNSFHSTRPDYVVLE